MMGAFCASPFTFLHQENIYAHLLSHRRVGLALTTLSMASLTSLYVIIIFMVVSLLQILQLRLLCPPNRQKQDRY